MGKRITEMQEGVVYKRYWSNSWLISYRTYDEQTGEFLGRVTMEKPESIARKKAAQAKREEIQSKAERDVQAVYDKARLAQYSGEGTNPIRRRSFTTGTNIASSSFSNVHDCF